MTNNTSHCHPKIHSPLHVAMAKALNIEGKQQKAQSQYEDNIQKAVSKYKSAKAEGKPTTFHKLENKYKVPYKTIQRHAKDEIKCLSQSAAERGCLSLEESNIVLENVVYLVT